MAKNRFVRWLEVRWDKDAARRLQSEAENALDKAGAASAAEFEGAMKVGGQKGARALTTSLQREYKLRMARASQQLAEGAINERAFRREGEKAAREFNAGLSSGIKRLQASGGGLTDAQFVGLGSRFKSTGAASAGMLAGLRSFAGPLAALFTVNEGLRQVRNAIEASDELANSIRKLGGTAKITGIELATLESESAKVQESFKLSTVVANDLTTEVAKLTSKAGDIDKTTDALRAFLDIGAARGLTAAQTLQAVYQSILGIDEGTDKLFNKNPSTIYDQWAQAIGRTAESMSDQEKAQALLDETMRAGELTRNAYTDWLKTTQGEAAQAAMEIRQLQADIGTTFGPTRVLLLKIELAVVGLLADILKRGPYDENLGFIQGQPMSIAGGKFRAPFNPADGPAGYGPRAPAPDLSADAARMAAAMNPERTAAELEIIRERNEAAQRAAEQAATFQRMEAEKQARFLKERSDLLGTIDPNVAGGAGFGTLDLRMRDTSGKTPMEEMGEDMLRFESIAEDVAGSVAGAWQDAFSLMIQEGVNVGNFFEGLGRGIAGSLGSALASFASGKAKENFAAAIEAAAYALGFSSHGNFVSAAAAWASAAEHGAAGVAWSALSGGAAAGGGALRSRGPGSTFDQGLSSTRDTFASGGIQSEVNIYINPWDPTNQGMQRGVKQAVDFATERYADRKINIRPYPGMPK